MKKAKSTQFCHAICGSHQTDYTDSAKNIKAAQWEKIIQAARRYAHISRKVPVSSVDVIMDSGEGNSRDNDGEVGKESEDSEDSEESKESEDGP